MKRTFITLAAVAGLAFSGGAFAQRGGGHGGGHGGNGHGNGDIRPVLCNTGPFVKLKARQLQEASFDLRAAVSNLPRPELWWDVARPVGEATRQINADLARPGRGVCLELNRDVRQAEQAIRQFHRKLERVGRGRHQLVIRQKLDNVSHRLDDFEDALTRGRGPRGGFGH